MDLYKKDKEYVLIKYDPDPMSPREWDNQFKFITWIRTYCSPDINEFESPSDFHEMVSEDENYIFKVHAYIHGGIVYYLAGSRPDDCWDSGFAGFIYCPKERFKTVKEAYKAAEAEINEYNQYCAGDVYCVDVLDYQGEFVDGCGGYYFSEDILSEYGLTQENFIGEFDTWDEIDNAIGIEEIKIKVSKETSDFINYNKSLIGDMLSNRDFMVKTISEWGKLHK